MPMVSIPKERDSLTWDTGCAEHKKHVPVEKSIQIAVVCYSYDKSLISQVWL